MKKIITTIILLAAAYSGKSQSPSWVNFAAPSNYQNYDAQEVSAGVDTLGNIYTGASESDTVNNKDQAMLVKYNAAGVEQWKKYYDNNDPAAYKNGTYVVATLVDKAGNSYLCGQGRHNGGSDKDFMIIKYDNAGNRIWIQYWDGGQNLDDYITCAAFDKAGNIVVAGYVNYFGTTSDDIGVAKWSTAGSQAWHYTYNNASINGEDRALAVACDTSNNVYITGYSFGPSHRDMISLKLNSAGNNQWTNTVPHTSSIDERGYSIAADASGNSYVTGSASDWITIKYSATGAVVWTNHFTDDSNNPYDTRKVLLDKFHNVVIAGDAGSNSASQTDLVVAQLDNSNGSELWSISYGANGIDRFTDVELDTNGYIYATGYYEGPLGSDIETLILSAEGSLLWSADFSNSLNASGGDRSYDLVVDKNRNVILAGISETRNSTSNDAVDVLTLKYNTSTTGINELKAEKINISIYPNPCSDHLNISFKDNALLGSDISVINFIGQVVLEEKLNALEQTINLNNLAKGIYMLKITNNGSSVSKKVIIQ